MLIKAIISTIIMSVLLLAAVPAQAKPFRYGEIYCNRDGFTCIKVKRGQSWKSLWPDEYQQEVVKRLNRMNTPLRRGMHIAVPDHIEYTDLMDISPFPHYIDAPEKKLLVVDPGVLAWAAYGHDGNLIHWGPISGGKNYCSDVGRRCRTVTGKFNMFRKLGSKCESRKFPLGKGGAPMPYCMFFYRGFAMHASTSVPGYHDSHGCIRLFYEDAQWINKEFMDLPKYRKKGTTVIINPYPI